MLAVLPFLFVAIPPLVDAPGHLAQFAIQAAPPSSPLRSYYDFHWALKLNLGTDLLVEALRPLFGLERAFLLVTASIPLLTVLAILCLARCANPGGAAAASWALPFAYAYPFNFGFLNYTLGMALSFLSFAVWIALAERPRTRAALFCMIIPALLICHAIGGGLLPLMILAAAAADARRDRPLAFLREIAPLAAALPVVAIWMFGGKGDHRTAFDLLGKLNALLFALRDQNRLLDLASIAAILLVVAAGQLAGARYARRSAAVVAAIGLLFLLTPNELDGSSYADTRIMPALLIVCLTLQDWSTVAPRVGRFVVLTGLGLFAGRMAVTTQAFAGYARSYAMERAALAHVVPGSRVLALVPRQCRASRQWRSDRLEHLPALAVVDRASWSNAMWDVPGLHLLGVRFRPSPIFYDDPSQYVWPAACVLGEPVPKTIEERRYLRRTIEQALPALPLARVDYLWLINTRLPAGYRGPLIPLWSNGRSTLYRTLHALPRASG